MPERLTREEVLLLRADRGAPQAEVGSVHVFAGGPGRLSYAELRTLVAERLAYVPRYRQRVRAVPGGLAAPVWVEEEDFDLSYHLRRALVAPPGNEAELQAFVSRVMEHRLDPSRPLWEMYLVEGLSGDRVAVVTKAHLSLVDGIDTVEIGQVLLDASPHQVPPADQGDTWQPLPEPSPAQLLAGALWENAQDGGLVARNLSEVLAGPLGTGLALGLLLARTAAGPADPLPATRPAPATPVPIVGPVSNTRRYATVALPLADLQAVRAAQDRPVHDVVLAVVTGGLRSWWLGRGDPLGATTSVAALVPVAVREEPGQSTALGVQVVPHWQRLPVGEPNPLVRLHQIGYGTRAHTERGDAAAAPMLVGIPGFAPPTLHALGARTAVADSHRSYDVLISYAPGPATPHYLAAAELTESYPVAPLSARRRLGVALTSYGGNVFVGLSGDGETMSDLDLLAAGMTEALQELQHSARRAGIG